MIYSAARYLRLRYASSDLSAPLPSSGPHPGLSDAFRLRKSIAPAHHALPGMGRIIRTVVVSGGACCANTFGLPMRHAGTFLPLRSVMPRMPSFAKRSGRANH